MTIVLGTRGSALALAQTRLVAEALGGDVEVRVIRTEGDASSRPLHQLGDGVFVIALEEALRRGEIDAAVHSLKDLPTDQRDGLVVAAVPRREDPRDVLITRERAGLAHLRRGARVGTGSPRRAAFLRALRPDLEVLDIRGNVDTRLRKVRDGDYEAVVLAVAGLRRAGIAYEEAEVLPLDAMPPAPGQGALAVQCRADDRALRGRLARIDDAEARAGTSAERAALRALGGSCLIPFGAHARVGEDGGIVLEAALARADGVVRVTERGADPEQVGARAAAGLREAVRVG